MWDLIKDLWAFMRERKKFWMAPIIIVLLLLGVLIVLAEGSAVDGRTLDELNLRAGDRMFIPQRGRGLAGGEATVRTLLIALPLIATLIRIF